MSPYSEQEQRDALRRIADALDADPALSQRQATQQVADELGVAASTVRGWAARLGVRLARASEQNAQARAAGVAYGRIRREQQRARIHELLEGELDVIEHEQSVEREAREQGGRSLYGMITGTSTDGEKLFVRAEPPDHAAALQRLATTHGILQDKARADEEAAGGEPGDELPDPGEQMNAARERLDELARRREAKAAGA